MIRGLHGMFYSNDADASRAFLRDKVKLPFTDVGGGWLIFDLPEGDLGFHPADEAQGGTAGKHDVSFYCDDIKGTVADLRSRGVQFNSEIADHGYGWVTYFTIPGGIDVQLYEPKYQKRTSKPAAAQRKPAAAQRKPAAAQRKPAAKPKATPKAAKTARSKAKPTKAAKAKPARGKR